MMNLFLYIDRCENTNFELSIIGWKNAIDLTGCDSVSLYL